MQNKIYKTNAIVISTSKYQDNSSIVNVIDEEDQIITLICKGVNNINSKNRAILNILSEVYIEYKLVSQTNDRRILCGVKLVRTTDFTNDLNICTMAYLVKDLSLKFKEEVILSYKFLNDFLTYVENGLNFSTLFILLYREVILNLGLNISKIELNSIDINQIFKLTSVEIIKSKIQITKNEITILLNFLYDSYDFKNRDIIQFIVDII